MSKKNNKPEEIKELEKLYKIKLFDKSKIKVEEWERYNYSLDTEGNVISISIPQANIKDVTPIGKLKSLISLNLTNNQIEDLSPLFPQQNLAILYLGGNKIKNLGSIDQCPQLKELIIWENPINDIHQIGKLLNLEELYCQRIGIKDLSFIKNLDKLGLLYAIGNQVQDISPLINLKNLKLVNLSSNLISNISCLENLDFRFTIDLSENNIKYLSRKAEENFNKIVNSSYDGPIHNDLDIENTNQLFIYDNPLEFPPVAVVDLGIETVKDYYINSEKFGHKPLSEGRIIVVGDGSAGKTSLIERILYNTFEQGKNQTNGIKIENWNLQHKDGRKLVFHIWDFGGQEIQHAVHKFFFTEGCLYLLVLDNRKEEEPEYWLQQIESLGGGAPVLVVFNKQDDNAIEIADRKFLKEKYPNIIGFYNTSCKTGFGISDFKSILEEQVINLRTVEEQFPNNWFNIKRAIEECTSGSQHYLNYDVYRNICNANNAENTNTQRLLLKYFTTIGAITWFGDTFLNFLHVLSPAWITQGVYKIVTSKKTAKLSGHINISDFKELLIPTNESDYTYEESHFGYILMMMKKFGLCYTPDDINILLPSAFGKEPKLEYSEFRGDKVRTYILQFKDYMPLALIHRFIAKKLPSVYDKNYWYSGIVIKDNKSDSLAMIHADKEAKRIYVRIKGNKQLGTWEHIRRELDDISSDYAKIPFDELIALDEKTESTVTYEDLVSHITANKSIYFHPKLQKDFNVGYLMGLFETKEQTIKKFKKGGINNKNFDIPENFLNVVINNLNNNSPVVNTYAHTEVNIDIDIQIINELSSNIKGEANYLLEEIQGSNKELQEALLKVVEFADETKSANNSAAVKEKGWGRRLKGVLQTLGNAGEQLKNVQDGGEALKSILVGIKNLAIQFNLQEIKDTIDLLIV